MTGWPPPPLLLHLKGWLCDNGSRTLPRSYPGQITLTVEWHERPLTLCWQKTVTVQRGHVSKTFSIFSQRMFIRKYLNALRAVFQLQVILTAESLASSVSFSSWSQSPAPHLAPSALVPIPFRGKNVKILPWLIPRWCLWVRARKRGIVQRDIETDRIKNDHWGLFRFKMHCVCWQPVGPTLFDVLAPVCLWAFEGFMARCDSAANRFQMPPVWEPGSRERGETGS